MQKQYLFVQLVVGSSTVWQVKQDVPADLCRRMTKEELEAIGLGMSNTLASVVNSARPEPAADTDKSKKHSRR